MGPNLSSIKIFQGTCGCMLCWVFFIVHVMSWLHLAMLLCSTASKRVLPRLQLGALVYVRPRVELSFAALSARPCFRLSPT